MTKETYNSEKGFNSPSENGSSIMNGSPKDYEFKENKGITISDNIPVDDESILLFISDKKDPEHSHESPFIDQIITRAGYNFEVWRCILLISLTMLTEGIYLTTFSALFTPFQLFYKIDEMTVSISSSFIFLAVGIGSAIIPLLSSRFKRTTILNYSFILMSIFSILLGLFKNIYIFTVLRSLIGLFLGITVPLILCILTENLPVYLRSFVLNLIWVTFTFGALFQLFVIQIIMPDLNPNKFNDVMLYISVVPVVTTIIYFFYLEDSPRNLILNHCPEEGFKILERIGNIKLTDEDKNRLVREIKTGSNKTEESSFKTLFNPKNLTTTLILTALFVISLFVLYCPMLIMSLTLKKVLKENKIQGSVVKQIMVVNFMAIFGSVIAGMLSEVQIVGRKFSIAIGFFIFALLNIFSFFYDQYFDLFLGAESVFCYLFTLVISSYAYEYYDTRIRGTATGYLYFSGRVASFFSQFIGIELDRIGTFLPYYLTTCLAIIGGILAISLPYETYGQYLDINTDKRTIKKDHEKLEVSTIITQT